MVRVQHGKRGFKSYLGIPFPAKNAEGKQDPKYTKLRNLCRKYQCTYPELLEKGIIKQDGEPSPAPVPQLKEAVVKSQSHNPPDKLPSFNKDDRVTMREGRLDLYRKSPKG